MPVTKLHDKLRLPTMSIAEVKLARSAELDLFVARSIEFATRQARNSRSRRTLYGRGQHSDTKMLNSEMLHFPAILPSGVSGKDAIGELPKKGVRIGEAGKQRPAKAGCRSIVVVRKQDLRKQGFPDDMITAMLKDQAQRIRIPAKKVAECKRIQLMLAHDDDRIVKGNVLSPRVSITEALVIAETVQTEQF